MILCTTETVPGWIVVEYLGLAKGCSVRGTHTGEDIVANMKGTLGGEVHEYTAVLAAVREQSLDRLIEDARKLGANGVVGLRFATSEISSGLAEMLVYGTAVRLERPT